VRTPELDFTVIDLVGYSADQIDAVRAYLRANHAADRGRIIAIGFDW
jgi:dienelactone hydrolase